MDELIDYVQSGANEDENVRKLLIKKQPLHSFSRLYNQGNGQLITYINTAKTGVEGIEQKTKEVTPISFNEISLNTFINFFKNPFKGYYSSVLNIYYNDEDVLLSENEVFELGNLEKWGLKNELILLGPDEEISLRNRLVKTGSLPLKNMADVVLGDLEEEIAIVRDLFSECIGDAQAIPTMIEIPIGDSKLKGELNNIYGNKIVVVSFSKKECKYLLGAYIQYMAALAAGLQVELYFISATKKLTYRATSITKENATNSLTALVELYKQGHERFLAFYPEFDINPDKLADITWANFQKAVKDKLENYMFPCTDRYILNEYNEDFFADETILETYKADSELLLNPISQLFPDYYKK